MAHISDFIATDIDEYLRAHEHKSLLRLITCGSADMRRRKVANSNRECLAC